MARQPKRDRAADCIPDHRSSRPIPACEAPLEGTHRTHRWAGYLSNKHHGVCGLCQGMVAATRHTAPTGSPIRRERAVRAFDQSMVYGEGQVLDKEPPRPSCCTANVMMGDALPGVRVM